MESVVGLHWYGSLHPSGSTHVHYIPLDRQKSAPQRDQIEREMNRCLRMRRRENTDAELLVLLND